MKKEDAKYSKYNRGFGSHDYEENLFSIDYAESKKTPPPNLCDDNTKDEDKPIIPKHFIHNKTKLGKYKGREYKKTARIADESKVTITKDRTQHQTRERFTPQKENSRIKCCWRLSKNNYETGCGYRSNWNKLYKYCPYCGRIIVNLSNSLQEQKRSNGKKDGDYLI